MVMSMRRSDRLPQRQFPSTSMPHGWFQIGWSSDFAADEAYPLRYFDCDLVAYRSDSGTLHVLDAFCRHMGAHLGYGSRIDGECVRCPYHGWLYDGSGTLVETPGSPQLLRAQIGAWPTAEVDGLAFVRHDPTGSLDAAPPPSGFVRSQLPSWPAMTATWRGHPMTPQHAADNVVDAGHFQHVHGSFNPAGLLSYEHDSFHFTALYEMEFGAGAVATWATPHGPIPGTIRTEAWGVGVMWNRLGGCDDVRSVLGVTPVSATASDLRLSVWIPTTRVDGSPLDEGTRDRWFAQQQSQVEADLLIWDHQTYVDKPPFLAHESAAMRCFRTYAETFYDR